MQFLELAAQRKRGLNWDAVRDNNQGDPSIQTVDLSQFPLRFPDNYYDGVFSDHFIEHIYKYQGIKLFEELLRILKPGGTVRTTWPAYDFVERLVSDEDMSEHPFVKYYHPRYCVQEPFQPRPKANRKKRIQEQCALGLLHQKGEHVYLWGKQEMIDTLKSLGYNNVTEREYGVSPIPEFNGVDNPSQIRAMHSTVVEASKPW